MIEHGPTASSVATLPDTVQIDSDACRIDALEFERLAASDDIEDLQACLALYRGELLDGLTIRESDYEDWLLTGTRKIP